MIGQYCPDDFRPSVHCFPHRCPGACRVERLYFPACKTSPAKPRSTEPQIGCSFPEVLNRWPQYSSDNFMPGMRKVASIPCMNSRNPRLQPKAWPARSLSPPTNWPLAIASTKSTTIHSSWFNPGSRSPVNPRPRPLPDLGQQAQQPPEVMCADLS